MARKVKFFFITFVGIIILVEFMGDRKTYSTAPTPKTPPKVMLYGLRKTIHESQWLQLFPNLKKMVEVVSDGNAMALTSANHTSIKLLNSDDLEIGGSLKAIITSYNKAGIMKTFGGDFFAVILRRPGSTTDGVTCQIADHMNGSYSVSCILPWEGAAIVEAKLVHPSETIYQLMKRYSSEKEYQIHQETAVLNSKNETEFTSCSVGFPDKSPDEICDCSNPTHGEKRTCLRAPSGECPKIILSQKKIFEGPAPNTFKDAIYCDTHNFLAPITGSGAQINIRRSEKSSLQDYFIEDLSHFISDPMTPSGWLVDGKWTSVKTRRTINVNRKTIEKCFTNKRIHFFGDSTTRYLYQYFIKALKLNDSGLDNRVACTQGRDAISKELNVTLQYRSHGPPLNNRGPESARPYMSDSFDAIREGGNGTIVIFTIGYHFHFFDPDVYLRRLRIIKKAVLYLLRRLPGAKVIVKDLHYHWMRGYARSPWLTYKLITILRHQFRDVKGVYYVEMWDYTLLQNNSGVHVWNEVFLCTVKSLMLFIC